MPSFLVHCAACSKIACVVKGAVYVNVVALGPALHYGACRLKSISAQHELHDQLKVMRCTKYVTNALHAADLEAKEQVSGIDTCLWLS